jgi:predicted transcriptional regulator
LRSTKSSEKEKVAPTKVYKLTVPIDKIIQHYEEQKSQEAAQTMQAIQRLKEMAST